MSIVAIIKLYGLRVWLMIRGIATCKIYFYVNCYTSSKIICNPHLLLKTGEGNGGRKSRHSSGFLRTHSCFLNPYILQRNHTFWHDLYKNRFWISDAGVQWTKENCYKHNVIRGTISTQDKTRVWFLLGLLEQKREEHFNVKFVLNAHSIRTTSWLSVFGNLLTSGSWILKNCAIANLVERLGILDF